MLEIFVYLGIYSHSHVQCVIQFSPIVEKADLSHSVQYGCSSAPVCGETTALVEMPGSQEGLQDSAETSSAGTGSSEGLAS